jgi:hypothetical protein
MVEITSTLEEGKTMTQIKFERDGHVLFGEGNDVRIIERTHVAKIEPEEAPSISVKTRMRPGEYALLCMAYTRRYSHSDTEIFRDADGIYACVVHYYPETVCNRREVEAIWNQWMGDVELILGSMHERIGTPSPRSDVEYEHLPR